MTNSNVIAGGILKAIIAVIGIAVVLYFFYQIQTIIVYLVVSLITTLMGNPILDFLKRRLRFSHLVATIATVGLFVLLLFGLLSLFVPLIINQGHNLSLLDTRQIEKDFLRLLNDISLFLENHNIDSKLVFSQAKLSSFFSIDFIPNFLHSVIGFISSFGIGLVAVLFITFFFLKDRVQFIIGLKKCIPDSRETQVINSLDKINFLLSRYFIGLLLQLFIVFILYLIVLLIFGIDNAIVIAFLCAILNIVPYLGPLIASVLAGFLTMLNFIGSDFQTEILPTTIYVLIGFWIVQIIDNNLSQPIIFSKSVSSHPLEIFLVILIAGFLSGIVGMIIAVPIYTILKVIGKEFFPNNIVIQLLTKDI
jgi:predicted PurR-regulated permease PerM